MVLVGTFVVLKPGYAQQTSGQSAVKEPFETTSQKPTPQPIQLSQAPQNIIERIEFFGNSAFKDLVLIEQLDHKPRSLLQFISGQRDLTILRDSLFQSDIQNLKNYYRERGYFETEVTISVVEGSRPGRVVLIYSIQEGPPLLARNLEFSILAPDTIAEELRNTFLNSDFWTSNQYIPGNILEPVRREKMVQQLSTGLRERGFAYSTIQVETIVDSTESLADVLLTIIPGERVFYNAIHIEGNQTVSEEYVKRISGLKEGEQFNITKLEQARINILNHHLFRGAVIEFDESSRLQAESRPADSSRSQPDDQQLNSSLDVQLRVREYPLRSLQVMAGVGTEDILRARVSWMHRNVNQKAHRFSAMARASFIEQEISGDYFIPYLINNQSSYSLTPFIQHLLGARRSYELFSAGLRQTILYELSPFLSGSFSHQLSYNEELTGRKTERLPREVLNYNVSSFGVTMAYTKGYRYQRGWAWTGTAEVSSPLGLATYSYQKVSANVLRYQPVTPKLELIGRVQAGSIFYNGSGDLPSNIVFYAGGTNSVRGWSREFLGPKRPFLEVNDEGVEEFKGYLPTGGRALLTSSIEARYSLDERWKGVGVAAFVDAGQVWDHFSAIDERPLQFGAGFGLRYDSVIGPVRVDIAMKGNPTQEDLNRFEGKNVGNVFRRFGVHLSIGSPF